MSKKGKCQQAAVKGNALMHWLCRSNSQNSVMSVRNDTNEMTHLISDITTVTSPSNSSVQHAKELAEIVNSSQEETGVNENIMTEAVTIQLDKSDMSDMTIFHHAGQRYIRCEPCYQHPNIVRIHSKNRKVPPISLKDGTRYRALILADHLKTSMHIATRKAFRQTSLTHAELLEKTPIGRYISDANLTLANKIGGLMLHVYTTAKKLTMSVQTLPARYVAGKLAESFNFNATDKEPPSIDFQYTNPTCIRELMAAIVKSDRDTFACHLKSCLALSLRCDGSVDRSQIDKIYVMAKTVSVDGIANLFFLGVAEPEERGAAGLFSAVKHACSSTMGTSDATDLFCHSSSIVTDGANVNKGDKNGLWVLLDNDRKQAFEAKHSTHPPLLKVWCTVHRSQLAWKAVTQCVSESRTLISEMASISTYFHASAVRTRELKEIAKKNDCSILKLPKHYDIRWTEYTASLVTSILISWNALVLYMRDSREKEAAGYLRVLTNKANLEVLSFLADVLSIFSRYQQQLQSDEITLLDVPKYTDALRSKLMAILDSPLVGGWVTTLEEQIDKADDGSLSLKGFQLTETGRRANNEWVTVRRDAGAIKNEIVQSLLNFISQQLDDEDIKHVVSVMEPFVRMNKSADIKAVHSLLCSDLDLQDLSMEFNEMIDVQIAENFRSKTLKDVVQTLAKSPHYKNVAIVLARLLAAKPHSADVERLISCSVALKSPERSQMDVDTENLYLYIYFNMPALDQWDPRPAVVSWMTEKDHRKRECIKGKSQAWYNGIFAEASKCNEAQSDEDEPPLKKPRKF